MTDIKRTAPRWMKILLVGSLCLNLLVVGAFVGARGWAPDKGPAGRDMRGGPLSRALAPDDRKALREALRAEPRDRNGRQEMRTAGEAVLSALRADPFDPDVLESALAQQQAVGQNLAARGQRALLATITDMTVNERAEFASRLEEKMKRGPRRPRN